MLVFKRNSGSLYYLACISQAIRAAIDKSRIAEIYQMQYEISSGHYSKGTPPYQIQKPLLQSSISTQRMRRNHLLNDLEALKRLQEVLTSSDPISIAYIEASKVFLSDG